MALCHVTCVCSCSPRPCPTPCGFQLPAPGSGLLPLWGDLCSLNDNGVQQGGGGLGMKGHAAPSPVAARASSGVQGPCFPSLMAPEGRDAGQLMGEVAGCAAEICSWLTEARKERSVGIGEWGPDPTASERGVPGRVPVSVGRGATGVSVEVSPCLPQSLVCVSACVWAGPASHSRLCPSRGPFVMADPLPSLSPCCHLPDSTGLSGK